MQKKQGISLIVLVITIIVMVILAGAIILTLNNSGVISKASEAVEDTDLANVKELAQTAWAEAYMNGAKIDKDYQDAVKAILEKNKVDLEDYGIVATTSGVKVAKGWLQDGLTVVKGDTVLKIGDNINYDETNNGTITDLTATDWQVLGANEDGELLILSTEYIDALELGSKEDFVECQNDYITGIDQLNELCKTYGQGKNATGVRSIEIEDVDKITGYDKTTYKSGTLSEYGNEVTYFYNGTQQPAYTSIKGYDGVLWGHVDGFHYYNGEKFIKADLSKETGIITKLKNSIYSYNIVDIETIDETSKAYIMLFGKYNEESLSYWLASRGLVCWEKTVYYDWHAVWKSGVAQAHLCAATEVAGTSLHNFGVRVVVSLSKDIQLTGNSIEGWNY